MNTLRSIAKVQRGSETTLHLAKDRSHIWLFPERGAAVCYPLPFRTDWLAILKPTATFAAGSAVPLVVLELVRWRSRVRTRRRLQAMANHS